jgi:hypothetical protein
MEEKNFFTQVADLFKKFNNLQSVINNVERSYQKTQHSYNPAKYIRGSKLLDGSKINYNEVVLKSNSGTKKDFTYEDYKNSLKENKTNTTLIPNVNVVNNNDTNGFSYESYIKQRQNTQSVNQVVPKDDLSSNNTDFIMNSIMRDKSNTGNSYLNFEVQKSEDKSAVITPDDNVYNPYGSLSFNEFKPVYKSGVTSDFNNINNQFSGFNNNMNKFNNNMNNMNNNVNNMNNNVNNLNNSYNILGNSNNYSNSYNNNNPYNQYKK